jgi:hypothetical protein
MRLNGPLETGAVGHAKKRIFHAAPVPFSAQAEAEDHSFKKRSLGGSCEQRLNPSRNLAPNETPWPGLICRISLYQITDAGRATRVSQNIAQLATHTALGKLFISDE